MAVWYENEAIVYGCIWKVILEMHYWAFGREMYILYNSS
jgi:hypothetical protein